ncbi:MAG: hypothetical protein WDO15_23105 [Bacteroidota bacterium]
MPDSTVKYLSESTVSSSNLVGLAAIRRVTINDSSNEISNNPVMRVNQLAWLNLQETKVTTTYDLPKDTAPHVSRRPHQSAITSSTVVATATLRS